MRYTHGGKLQLKVRKEFETGLTWLVTDQLRWIRFGVVSLNQGQSWTSPLTDQEQGVVLLSGSCKAIVNGQDLGVMGPRKNVFEDPPWGLYIPGDTPFQLQAESASELALCRCPSKSRGRPRMISPAELDLHHRGRPGFERKVVDIIVENVRADTMMVGETTNLAGQWSSYPPHKHEKDDLPREALLEELYLYKIDPPQGFGCQRIYTDDRSLDQSITLEHNDLVIIPRGYHPVAAAPGYRVYYLWVLAGPKRKLVAKDDPRHQWISG